MNELRFDGKTAIVTGAGGNPSLGRAHALLLASRGANVVVNDIGSVEGAGYEDRASADAVVHEIRALGGRAVASNHSVATEEGAIAIIGTALDAFGGIDILVNNAGLSIVAPFDTLTPQAARKHLAINLLGTMWVSRAAWPHMKRRRYGRIVNTASPAFTGIANMSAYAASKGGLFSLTRVLALEGAAFGIKVNTVSPGAFTRMTAAQHAPSSPVYIDCRKHLPAELVSPMVAFLVHDSCPVTGECFEAMGGRVSRVYIANTAGIVDPALTIEKIADGWAKVMDTADSAVVEIGNIDTSTWILKSSQLTSDE